MTPQGAKDLLGPDTWKLDHWTIGPCCSMLWIHSFFPFLFHPPTSFLFQIFRLPTKQTPISFGRSQDHFLHNGSRKPLHAKSGTSVFSKFCWSLALQKMFFSEACSAHHRRICGSLQEQTSETGHWHRSSATRRKVGNAEISDDCGWSTPLQLNDPHEMTGWIALGQEPQTFKETQQTSINTIPSSVAVVFEYSIVISMYMCFKMFETWKSESWLTDASYMLAFYHIKQLAIPDWWLWAIPMGNWLTCANPLTFLAWGTECVVNEHGGTSHPVSSWTSQCSKQAGPTVWFFNNISMSSKMGYPVEVFVQRWYGRPWKSGDGKWVFSALAPLDHFITVPKPDLCSVKSLTARDATGCWDPAHSLFLLPCGQWEHASVNQTHLGPFSQFSAKLYQTGEFRSLIA